MAHKIERTVLGTIANGNGRRVIGAAKNPLLPQVAVATRVGGKISAGEPRFELIAIASVPQQRLSHACAAGAQAIGMKVQLNPRMSPQGKHRLVEPGPVHTRLMQNVAQVFESLRPVAPPEF